MVGSGPVVALRPDNVSVLRPAEQLFDDMLAGWAGQQSSRLLSSKTIGTREAQVRRFAGFCAASPWEWAASDVEEWTTELLSGPRPPLFVQQQVGHRWGSTTALYFGVSGDYRNRVLRHALDEAFCPPSVAPAERN